jgi:hypothetical protein
MDLQIYAPYIALAVALIVIYNIRKNNRDRPDPPAGPRKPGGGGGKK